MITITPQKGQIHVNGRRTNTPKSSPEYYEEYVSIVFGNPTEAMLQFTTMEQINALKSAVNTAEKMLTDILHKRDLIEKL